MSEKPAQGPDKNPSDDQALAALKRQARPQPKPVGEPLPPEPENHGGSGSATGFVGTLGKPSGGPLPGDSVVGTPGVRPPTTLRMAREVRTSQELSPLAQIAKDAVTQEESRAGAEEATQSPPRSPGIMPHLMMSLAVLLLIIGGWAVGALMYMHNFQPISPRDVNYPFLTWQIDLHNGGAYTPASIAMAWSMLVCLPVATLLLFLGWSMRRPKP